LDEQGRLDVAKSRQTQRLTQLIEKRHAELQQSIDARHWFDPWILTSDKPESPRVGTTLGAGLHHCLRAFSKINRYEHTGAQ